MLFFLENMLIKIPKFKNKLKYLIKYNYIYTKVKKKY